MIKILSKEEVEKIKSIVLRGNDIESACLIMEEVIWNNLVITGGRLNITKIAMRQILNFIEEYKNKGYLDIIREKVHLKEENKKLNKMIDEMADMISSLDFTFNCVAFGGHARFGSIEEVKKYFEKKVEKDNVKN